MFVVQHAEIDQPNADMFKSKVQTPIKVVNIMKYASFGVAGFLLLIAVLISVYVWRRVRLKEKRNQNSLREFLFSE